MAQMAWHHDAPMPWDFARRARAGIIAARPQYNGAAHRRLASGAARRAQTSERSFAMPTMLSSQYRRTAKLFATVPSAVDFAPQRGQSFFLHFSARIYRQYCPHRRRCTI